MRNIILTIIAVLGLTSCKQSEPSSIPLAHSKYIGVYKVGRLVTDTGLGSDPINFSVAIYKNKFEWIIKSNVSTSKIISSQQTKDKKVLVVLENEGSLVLSGGPDGVTIRDENEGKTLFCRKEKETKR